MKKLILLSAFVSSLITATAMALPVNDLFVQVSNKIDPSFTFYIAFTNYNFQTPALNMGGALVPMNADVATTLVSLPLEKVIKCQSEYLKSGRNVYVYSLVNCN